MAVVVVVVVVDAVPVVVVVCGDHLAKRKQADKLINPRLSQPSNSIR